MDAHKNFAYSTVATAPAPATSGTSLVVQTGDGAKFPSGSFNATVWPANVVPTDENAEIVRCTVSGDTLTITRAQEGSSARSIGVGDQIAATITAKTLTDVEDAIADAAFNGGVITLPLQQEPSSAVDVPLLVQYSGQDTVRLLGYLKAPPSYPSVDAADLLWAIIDENGSVQFAFDNFGDLHLKGHAGSGPSGIDLQSQDADCDGLQLSFYSGDLTSINGTNHFIEGYGVGGAQTVFVLHCTGTVEVTPQSAVPAFKAGGSASVALDAGSLSIENLADPTSPQDADTKAARDAAIATVGATKQPLDPDLTAFAALDSSTGGVAATDGAGWIKKTYAQFKTALGLSTADVPDSTDKRYVTDAQRTVIGNTSGTNTGDQTSVSGNAGTATKLATARNIDGQSFDGSAAITVVAPGTHAATSKATPVDADELPLADSAASFVLKKLTWANLKATIKAYTDTLYPSGSGTSSGTNTGDQTTVSGNAGTATALQTARAIDGQSFDGTAAITVIAPGTHAATGKTTPVDADEMPIVDSAASNVLKKLTWANVKATLKTYFDTLYQATGAALDTIGAGTDITTNNASTSKHGLLPKLDSSATKVLLGDGTWGLAPLYATNVQTASYTLVLGDAGLIVEMNVGSANNLTVPPNSSVAFPIGTSIPIFQPGAGQTTVVAGSGVTIRSASSRLKLTGQYSSAVLRKRGTDEWVLAGDISS